MRERERGDNERNFHIRCFIKLVDRYFSNNYRQGKGNFLQNFIPSSPKFRIIFVSIMCLIQLVARYIYIYMANLMDQRTCIKAFFFSNFISRYFADQSMHLRERINISLTRFNFRDTVTFRLIQNVELIRF